MYFCSGEVFVIGTACACVTRPYIVEHAEKRKGSLNVIVLAQFIKYCSKFHVSRKTMYTSFFLVSANHPCFPCL